MISYSTNWMGPISMDWYRERGLTEMVEHATDEIEEITTYYSAGRIDIRDDTKSGYDGWDEYSLPPIHGEDWNNFGDWLDNFETEELWEFDDLITRYEQDSGRKIRWADDVWYKCYECGLVTDLRETSEKQHKMDCRKNR